MPAVRATHLPSVWLTRRRARDVEHVPCHVWMELPEDFRRQAALASSMFNARDARRRRQLARTGVVAGALLATVAVMGWPMQWWRSLVMLAGLVAYVAGIWALPDRDYTYIRASRPPYLTDLQFTAGAERALTLTVNDWMARADELPAAVAADPLLGACGVDAWLSDTCGRRGAEVARALAPSFGGSLRDLAAAALAAVA
jgi:hypothetical protein